VKRYPGDSKGRCSAVVSDGLVYAVATDPVCADGIVAQTRNTLHELDRVLAEAGSGKLGLVQATVYLSDISEKAVMDPVWCTWIGPEENWPQRACVGADLDDRYLIEIVVIAKVLQRSEIAE
jgi:enamine deaminase RidA (YjgF/YER057c/UK114 family)